MELFALRWIVIAVIGAGIALHGSIEHWRQVRLGAEIATCEDKISIERHRLQEHRAEYLRALDQCLCDLFRSLERNADSATERVDGTVRVGSHAVTTGYLASSVASSRASGSPR